jgi:hypothetical protein
MLLAREMDLLAPALETCREIIIDRLMPTYPQHASRRCEELQEIERTMLLSAVAHKWWMPRCPSPLIWRKRVNVASLQGGN